MKLPLQPEDLLLREIWEKLKNTDTVHKQTKAGKKKFDFTKTVFSGLDQCAQILAKHFQLQVTDLQPCRSKRDQDGKVSEYMLDYSWTTYPRNRLFAHDQLQWPRTLGILLAAESEVGRKTSAEKTCRDVLEDFIKLADIKSPFKVMVYRVPQKSADTCSDWLRRRFVEVLVRHRSPDRTERWLFVGIPRKCLIKNGCVYVLRWSPTGPVLERPDWAPPRGPDKDALGTVTNLTL